MTLRRMMCCGMVELNGLAGYLKDEDSLLIEAITECHSKSKHVYLRGGFMPDLQDLPRARSYRLLLFSEAVHPNSQPSGYGQRLVDLIQSRGLGTVTVMSDWGLNPNSGNQIKVWAWEVDHAAFWLQYAEGWKREQYSKKVRDYWCQVQYEDELATRKSANFVVSNSVSNSFSNLRRSK